MAFHPDDAAVEPTRHARIDPATRARRIGWALLAIAVIGTVVLGLSPSPYAVERPGPVYDTLGTVPISGSDVPIISIPSQNTYPTTGKLDMLTVYVDGSPDQQQSWIQIAASWFDPSRAVVPLDEIYQTGETQQQADQQSSEQMQNSQQSAVAAALTQLGIAYSQHVTVAAVLNGSPADGVLKPDDQLDTINGVTIDSVTTLRSELKKNGTATPATLTITRAGAAQTVTITPTPDATNGNAPILGISAGGSFVFPFDVKIQLDNVGGPSAGMMFALAIYDKLTPGGLAGDQHIAGTGTIDPDGTVGPIGGIRQKMFGAKGDGATWFLAPAANCDEVTGHIPAGLTVYSVSTLKDAIHAVTEIGSGASTADLATCPAG